MRQHVCPVITTATPEQIDAHLRKRGLSMSNVYEIKFNDPDRPEPIYVTGANSPTNAKRKLEAILGPLREGDYKSIKPVDQAPDGATVL